MKIEIENREGMEITRITTSAPQIGYLEGPEGKYYDACLTVFVIEKEDGKVFVTISETDPHLAAVYDNPDEFRREEDNHYLNDLLKEI